MNAGIAVLDFVLLLATVRLVAWPLLAQPAAAHLGPVDPVSGAVSPTETGADLAGSAADSTASATDPPELTLSDRLEQAVADRKAALIRTGCPSCGQPIADDDRFCRSCGTRLSRQDGEV